MSPVTKTAVKINALLAQYQFARLHRAAGLLSAQSAFQWATRARAWDI
jgi:hypothetical protein